jgi:hypothetical protein
MTMIIEFSNFWVIIFQTVKSFVVICNYINKMKYFSLFDGFLFLFVQLQ